MAAKKIQISNDAESTWDDLPGSEGNFTVNGEPIEDTILGQNWNSALTGLVEWSVTSNGIFKGFAGYLAELKKPGTPTAAAGEACAQESGQIYAITDQTKAIWDRSVAVVVLDNAVDRTANVESIDYLFGRVTFEDGFSVVEPVTVDVTYLPLVAIGKGTTYTLNMTANAIDDTDFTTAQANSGSKTFSPGLRSVAFQLQGIFDATENAKTDLTDRSELIIEIDPAGDGSSIARGFFRIVGTSQGGAVGALEDETIDFMLNVPFEEGPAVEIPFGWKHVATTLSEALQSAIASFMTELNTYDVQYLPTGVEGESPLNGIKGNMMITDLSLSGGLNNMNEFTVTMQGTGAFTEV